MQAGIKRMADIYSEEAIPAGTKLKIDHYRTQSAFGVRIANGKQFFSFSYKGRDEDISS